MKLLPEGTEIEYLRYFFDQVHITPEERVFLEEGFELCFNKRVPDNLKIEVSIRDERPTDPAPPPSEVMEDMEIPRPPRSPSLRDLLLDKTNKGDYILMQRGSGEHVSLSLLIRQLKEMTEEEDDE